MVYCSALNCQNATSGVYKNSSVTFYGFPLQNKPLLKQWIHNMGRDMGTPSKHQRLCSKHFEDSSFEIDPLKIRKNRRLLKEAVPKKFILGEDGNWLVGTPRSFCGVVSNKTRKRIRNPESLKVPGAFDDVAAHEGKNLEAWQKELYKKVIKDNYESIISLGKDYSVSKNYMQAREELHVRDRQDSDEREIPMTPNTVDYGIVIKTEVQDHDEGPENMELHGSLSGGSQDLVCQSPDKGVAYESYWSSESEQRSPVESRMGNFSLGEGESSDFKDILFCEETHVGERLYICTECNKTFKLKRGLLKHKRIHTKRNQISSYICTDCGKSFGRHADLIRHHRTHTGERPYKCTECEKSFTEKPRLTNHLRTHNIYM
ncbi:zinc finger protein 777-like [Alligator sinensis]|uniref:Zinc finger protein 777-like n=1 Tax=Alligator sinensis TaxID=38654 RepID=A0A1U8DV85_ALLSI|nr:zinc finger protein 777-like [Alligator sinensis]